MNHHTLDQFLQQLDPIETVQKETLQNINEFGGNELMVQEGEQYPRMPEHLFFDRGPIYISKHHRFAEMPLHVHSFIEMNYVYSGSIIQTINDQEIILTQGQMCLLDTDVPHSISRPGENDILINIIMKKETLNSALLSRLGSSGIVTDFLINAISMNTNHDRYIVFQSVGNENLQYMIKNMMCEFFDPAEYSQEMISSYCLIIFTELMRVYGSTNYKSPRHSKKTDLISVLKYIEKNYNHCSLKSLASEFNFNPNYLGNLLKKNTGKTFVEWVQSQRMNLAGSMLAHSHKTIDEISAEVGYESLSFFYKKFAEHYGCTPAQYREQQKKA